MGRQILIFLIPCALSFLGCFPRQAGPRLVHFQTEAPAVGSQAPNFVLRDLEGNTVELANQIGEKPVVLRLGSHSCPVYRYRRFTMQNVIDEFQERVLFLAIYTREAHPVGSKSPYAEAEWDVWLNKVLGVRVREPKTESERMRQAIQSHQKLNLSELMVVDNLDNTAWGNYGSAASPAFVIDQVGRVALRQVWVNPKEIRTTLERLLAEDSYP